MLERLTDASEVLGKALKAEDNADLFKDLTDNHKSFKQMKKDLEMRDLYQERSRKVSPKPPGYFTAVAGFNKKIEGAATTLMLDVEKSIVKEKNKNEKSKTYRALKVYLADIKLLIAKLVQDHKFELEASKLDEGDAKKESGAVESKAKTILLTLRQIGTNIDAGVAQGVKFCKEVMADPTPTQWNRINTDYGARRLSQAMTNLVKYCYTSREELRVFMEERGNTNELKAVVMPKVVEQIKELQFFLKQHEAKIVMLGKPSGSDAFDGSIGLLGDSPKSQLPLDTPPGEVHRAVKHLSALLKEAVPIAKHLKEFGF